MKKIFLMIAAAVLSVANVAAQNCGDLFPMKKGVKFVMANYDKNGALSSKVRYEVKDAKYIENGREAGVVMVVADKSGKDVSANDFTIKCQNDKLFVDMSPLIGNMNIPGMDMDMEMSYIEYPHDMKVGDELPEGHMKIEFVKQGKVVMSMTMKVTERKVVAKETITTPAGTFECFKIEEINEMTGMYGNTRQKHVVWIAKNAWNVKSENYTPDGKLLAYSELVSIEGL